MDYALQDPRLIQVSTSTQQLLTEVTTAVDRLNKIRPLSPGLALRLREALLPDRVVASLNMEGIVATRRQTLAVMDAMRVQESIGAGEKEIYNALKADEFVHDAVVFLNRQGLQLKVSVEQCHHEQWSQSFRQAREPDQIGEARFCLDGRLGISPESIEEVL